MSRGADIISLSDRAKQSLAAARAGGTDEARVAHLERISGHALPSAPVTGQADGRPTDIAFPLRSIPKWVPADD